VSFFFHCSPFFKIFHSLPQPAQFRMKAVVHVLLKNQLKCKLFVCYSALWFYFSRKTQPPSFMSWECAVIRCFSMGTPRNRVFLPSAFQGYFHGGLPVEIALNLCGFFAIEAFLLLFVVLVCGTRNFVSLLLVFPQHCFSRTYASPRYAWEFDFMLHTTRGIQDYS